MSMILRMLIKILKEGRSQEEKKEKKGREK